MKTHEELIRKDLEWHEKQDPIPLGIDPRHAAGFVAGLRHALIQAEKFPDWEEVAEKLMDALTIYGEILDDMPTGIEDLIGDAGKNSRVDEAFESYKSAHFMLTSE